MEMGLHHVHGYKDQLMYLPLDYAVSDYVLRRRKAISFGSSTVFASHPRLDVSKLHTTGHMYKHYVDHGCTSLIHNNGLQFDLA